MAAVAAAAAAATAKSIPTASIATRRKADGADGAKKLLIDEAAAALTAMEFVGHDNHVE